MGVFFSYRLQDQIIRNITSCLQNLQGTVDPNSIGVYSSVPQIAANPYIKIGSIKIGGATSTNASRQELELTLNVVSIGKNNQLILAILHLLHIKLSQYKTSTDSSLIIDNICSLGYSAMENIALSSWQGAITFNFSVRDLS